MDEYDGVCQFADKILGFLYCSAELLSIQNLKEQLSFQRNIIAEALRSHTEKQYTKKST